MCGAWPRGYVVGVAFLRSPAGSATLSALLALYLLWGPVAVALTRQTPVALLVGAATWGCAVWLICSRSVSGRNALLLLVVVAGAAAMHAIEPFTGLGFHFFAAFAAPWRVRLRAAVPLTVLALVALPLVSWLNGLDMAVMSGVTTGLAYSVVISFLIWYVSSTRRQAAEVAEARAGEAVLQERARLAREVHDILAHAQSAQIIHLEGARLLLKSGSDPARALDRVERAVSLARAGLEETRRALDTLRGEDLPLPERLERLAAEFRASTGASCALTVDTGVDALPAEAKLAVARTAQEALTNVRKHAPGAAVSVSLRRLGRWCELEVRDDGASAVHGSRPPGRAQSDDIPGSVRSDGVSGSGLSSSTAESDGAPGGVRIEGASGGGGAGSRAGVEGAGYGLIGMRERAELIGGSLTAEAGDGGFAVLLRVPA